MKQTQKYVSFIYWQWLHLTVLPPSSVPTSILRVPSSNQVICFFSPLNSDSIIKISENTSGLKWSQVKKKKKKTLFIPTNHLICIDSALCSISRALQPAFFFGEAWPLPNSLCSLFICMPLRKPSLYVPRLLYFASYFICGHHYLLPIFCMREIPLFQVRRNESFWKCTLPLKCQKLRPEYQLLHFDACCWTPTASSHPCCCSSSKVRRGPLRMTPFLRGFSSAAQVHYHFCQLSLLCKGSNLERSLPLLTRHRSEAHGDDSSGNSLTICCIWPHDNQNVPLRMSLPALLHADLTKCRSILH